MSARRVAIVYPSAHLLIAPNISQNSLIEFTDITAQSKTVNTKCTLTFFVVLGMRSERKTPKMENQHLVSQSRQCSNTQVGLGYGYLSKEQ